MHKIIPATFLLALFTFAACTKDMYVAPVTEPEKTTTGNLTTPSGFNWEIMRKVTFKIGVKSSQFPNTMYGVRIYDGDPVLDKLLVSGSANNSNPFEVTLTLPPDVSGVYLVSMTPDAKSSTQKLTIGPSGVVTAQVAN